MNNLPWCRLYTEFASDPKIQILAFEDQRHFVMLLCLKGNGTLDSKFHSETYRERLISKALGLDVKSALEAKRRLVEGGLVDEDWNPHAWDKRQFNSDSSTARVHKYREKQKRNVTETLQERPCNGTDTDTDTDTEKKKTVMVGLELDAWERWTKYRTSIGKPIKSASTEAAQRKLASFGASQSSVVEESIANGYQGLFAPKANNRGKVSIWE